MIRPMLVAALLTLLAVFASLTAARAQETATAPQCDLALSLGMDVSASINTTAHTLTREVSMNLPQQRAG